jgi:hypothetical protein
MRALRQAVGFAVSAIGGRRFVDANTQRHDTLLGDRSRRVLECEHVTTLGLSDLVTPLPRAEDDESAITRIRRPLSGT